MNRFATALCALYLAIVMVFIGLAMMNGHDFKGHFVFLQLPIALQSELAVKLGVAPALSLLPWPVAYALLVLATLIFIYGVGWVTSLMWRRG